MKALRLQLLHTCDGSQSLSINATRNIGPKRPRRLACFAYMVNKLVVCFASSNESQKRQRYFKAVLLHAEVVYFPHIFPLTALYIHFISINYTENVTDLYAHAQNSGYQALLSDFSSTWVRGYGREYSRISASSENQLMGQSVVLNLGLCHH